MHTPDFECLVPDWPAPPQVRALCSTRGSAGSAGRYTGLNLGLHVGDDPLQVARNRERLQSAMGVRAVFLEQVHGIEMLQIDLNSADALPADGAYTQAAQVACAVMVADCLPVLFCDSQGHTVAAAHAGWRGLLGAQGEGVLESAVAAMACKPEAILAWLGPCIGPRAFEVGNEVRAAFVAQSASSASCFMPLAQGKWLADLPALARQRLARAGVVQTFGNDGSTPWCTVANPSRFFSHRRDGISGRQAACIWRVA